MKERKHSSEYGKGGRSYENEEDKEGKVNLGRLDMTHKRCTDS